MKILSIDFDIIMYPCIKIYNNEVSGGDNPTKLWNYFNSKNIGQNLYYDAAVLTNIGLLMIKAIKQGAKFIPITNHEEIVKYLEKNELLQEENPIEIVNIDFHHDICYNDEALLATKYFDNYNCSNWLGYLLIQKFVTNAIWYKAPNSDLCEVNDVDKTFQENIKIKSIQQIPEDTNEYDYVFFCLSPQWIPYNFVHLYSLLCDICNEVSV